MKPLDTSAPSSGQPIVLLGMMGAGKTTVGRLVAARLGFGYLDNDDAVRDMTGREPAEIRATDGEDALHQLESDALAWALAGNAPVVVGAAGFVVEDPRAAGLLAGDVHVVWLRASPETLRARIGSGQGRRAEATDLDWLRQRAAERASAYQALADTVIDVDELTPDAVAQAIVAAVRRPSADG